MIRVLILLAAAIGVVFALSLARGDYPVALIDIAGALTGDPAVAPEIGLVVWDIRLPRALLALCVGAVLAVAGAMTQAALRNPLAEPSLLGINSGAAFAAMALMVGLRTTAPDRLALVAFAGALVMALAIHLLALRNGTSSLRIILIGIGLGALAGAGASFLSAFGDIALVQRAMVWLAGSVHGASWRQVESLALWTALPLVLVWCAARELDALAFDDDVTRSLGMPVDRVRGLVILTAALLSAAAVAAAGLIGFIGLVAPHIARRLVGRRHGRLLPVCALTGAFLVMAADLAGRTVIAPAELPAGIATALMGAPILGFLLWRRQNA